MSKTEKAEKPAKAATPLAAKLKKIEVLVMDVDGTLTDGSILLAESGEEIKPFHSRDGIGLKLWKLAGRESAFITARHSKAVTRRAGEIGVRDVILGSSDKGNSLRTLCNRRQVTLEQVAFMGDDLQDLGALSIAGVSIAVADAPPEVRERVDFVTKAKGGQAAVREAVEMLLKAQGKFQMAVNHFIPK